MLFLLNLKIMKFLGRNSFWKKSSNQRYMLSMRELFNYNKNNNKLYYQTEKLNLIYTHNILIQKKVTFTQNNWKANLAE